MTFLPCFFTVFSLLFAPAAAGNLSDSTLLSAAKNITGDLVRGVSQSAGKEFIVRPICHYNDQRFNTDLTMGEVQCNFTLRPITLVTQPVHALLVEIVARIGKTWSYNYNVTCNGLVDANTKKEITGTQCTVRMSPTQLMTMTLEVSDMCNEQTALFIKNRRVKTRCDTREGRVPVGGARCTYDYTPENPSDAFKSQFLVKSVQKSFKDIVKKHGFSFYSKCQWNAETDIANNLLPGQIQCDLEIMPKKA